MSRLLALGDVHLGAGPENGRRPGDRLRDQAAVLAQIADLAIEEGVDGVLVAGDTFNGPAAPPEQLDVFARFIEQMQGRIPVLAITGNGVHDLSMRETNGLAIFNHVDGIQVSSTPDVYPFAGCAVATLPWVSPARLVAARGGGDRDEIHADVAQILVDIADHARADCDRVAPGAPAILMAHWSVSGASLPNGLPVDQLREPVIPLADLAAVGFDAIVLGHIHKSQDLREGLFSERRDQPPIWYVGSPLPLNHGEAGITHGAWILNVSPGASGEIVWVPIESRPFITLDVDLTGDEDTSGLAYVDLGYAAKGHDLTDAIVRFRYRATSDQARRIDIPLLRRELLDAGAAVVRVQPDIVRPDRARVQGLDETVDELQGLDMYIEANGIDAGLAGLMRDRTRHYLETAAA